MEILKQLYTLKSKHKQVVIDAPTLYETQYLRLFCYPIIVVACRDIEVLTLRIVNRTEPAITEQQAKERF